MTQRTMGDIRQGGDEHVIYWRKPNGWITWADTESGTKMRDYSRRGFEPLWKYGNFNVDGYPGSPVQIWERILSHPDGPAEFPVEQVVSLRWYNQPPVPGVRFPQLTGLKIKEYRCPECDRAPFVHVVSMPKMPSGIMGLGNHLRIHHDWDRLRTGRH